MNRLRTNLPAFFCYLWHGVKGMITLNPGNEQGGRRFPIFKNTLVAKEPQELEYKKRDVSECHSMDSVVKPMS